MAHFYGDTLDPIDQTRIEQEKLRILGLSNFDDTTKAVLIRELWLTNGLEPGTWRRRAAGPDNAPRAMEGSGSVSLKSEFAMLRFFLYAGMFFVLWIIFSQKFPEQAHIIHGVFWDLVDGVTQNGFKVWDKFCAWIDAAAVKK